MLRKGAQAKAAENAAFYQWLLYINFVHFKFKDLRLRFQLHLFGQFFSSSILENLK